MVNFMFFRRIYVKIYNVKRQTDLDIILPGQRWKGPHADPAW